MLPIRIHNVEQKKKAKNTWFGFSLLVFSPFRPHNHRSARAWHKYLVGTMTRRKKKKVINAQEMESRKWKMTMVNLCPLWSSLLSDIAAFEKSTSSLFISNISALRFEYYNKMHIISGRALSINVYFTFARNLCKKKECENSAPHWVESMQIEMEPHKSTKYSYILFR